MSAGRRATPQPARLRVAIVGSPRFGVAEPFAGGLEAHTVVTARARLRRAGHQVTVFAGPADQPVPDDLDIVPIVDRSPRFDGVGRSDTQMSDASTDEVHAGYERVMEMVDDLDRFDVVHNNSLHAVPVRADTSSRIPMVHVLHCPPFHELVAAHDHRRRHVEPHRRGDVISVSASLAGAWGSTASAVVSNGVSIADWSARPGTATSTDERCVWVGRIVEEKGAHLAIDAARMAGRPIVLAGPIQQRDHFERDVRPRLGSDARYAGHLDRAGLAALFHASGVGVVTPCWEEPFGLVVAEMLAAGLPVAAFRRGAISSIVDDEVARLADPGDVPGLARAITRASSIDRTTCRRFAAASMSDDRMVERYVDHYRVALDRASGSGRSGERVA